MEQAKSYVRLDEHGVMRVGDTRVSLESVVYPFREGRSPEAIRRSYPALSLEEVYGAVAFYLTNRPEVDAYLQRQESMWQALREEQDRDPSPLVRRLKAVKAQGAKAENS